MDADDKLLIVFYLCLAALLGWMFFTSSSSPKDGADGSNHNNATSHREGKASSSSGITNPASRYYDPIEEDNGDQDDVYYDNCSEARAGGAESIEEGEPGYREELDRDGDGVACEPWHGR